MYMSRWHHIRRLLAAVTAGLVAAYGQRQGMSLWLSVVFGIACAIVMASLIFPLVWKPPKGGGSEGE